MASPRHQAIVGLIRLSRWKRAFADRESLLAGARARRAKGPATPPGRLKSLVEIGCDESAGFPVYTLTPAGAAPDRPMLYLHGGAYVHDAAPQHFRFAATVARRTGRAVRLPMYPLAPEHTWRDSFDQCVTLGRASDGTPPLLLGDSAGGGFALAVASRLATEGLRPSVVLIAPWLDLTFADPPTVAVQRRDPWLAVGGLRAAGELWAAGEPARAETSPLFGDIGDIDRLLIFSGDRDILHAQCLALAAKAEAAGVDCTLTTGPGLIHVYPLLPIAEARPALAATVAFINTLT